MATIKFEFHDDQQLDRKHFRTDYKDLLHFIPFHHKKIKSDHYYEAIGL